VAVEARKRDLEHRLQRLESLIAEVESVREESARKSAVETIQALLQLHGEGLERILELASSAGEPGAAFVRSLGDDELVGELLLLHGLHPVGLRARVEHALGRLQAHLAQNGASAELQSVEGGVVRVGLRSGDRNGPATPLRYAIEQAILEAAPDVASIEVASEPPPEPVRFAQLGQIKTLAEREWRYIGHVDSLQPGQARIQDVAGVRILFCRVDRIWYAYLDRCPGCDGDLTDAALDGPILRCVSCWRRYDVTFGGHSPDASGLHLAPVPLAVDGEHIRIATTSG
jgi:nitrite reductase/ring-hydroxylating ferredoxin subunit